jgi:predicted transcriptional regulator
MTPMALSLADVRDLLDADVIWCPNPASRIEGIVAADLMSDVLVDSKPGVLLLTGLGTVQAIRTAAIADLAGVVFVHGKRPPADAVALAKEKNIPVLVTSYTLFAAAGALYAAQPAPPAGPAVPAHG